MRTRRYLESQWPRNTSMGYFQPILDDFIVASHFRPLGFPVAPKTYPSISLSISVYACVYIYTVIYKDTRPAYNCLQDPYLYMVSKGGPEGCRALPPGLAKVSRTALAWSRGLEDRGLIQYW